ncbi:MAG: hypothetical protein J6X79_07505 [Bacteroidales bacterium]|nr:hypothetical protein [Bacteroidales bacterium]
MTETELYKELGTLTKSKMFRVLGKRRPEFVKPYLQQLNTIAETDSNRVVRIHCQGAIKATLQ